MLTYILFIAVVTALVRPVGGYIERVFTRQPTALDRACLPLERWLYRVARVDPAHEMTAVFYKVTTAVAMLAGRFGLAIPALALAGLFARQGRMPLTIGTLRTDSVSFGVFLVGSLVVLTAPCYVPALALGPVLEHLMLFRR